MNSENQPSATNFPALFAHNVAAQPDRLALVTTTCALTYAELNVQADRIAAALFAVAGRGSAPIGLLFGQEIAAVDAHQVLTRNGVVVIAGDEEDAKHGYPVMVGNRTRHWVTGFAELAVVTGACLLPFYSELLDDDRLQLVICPALPWDTNGCHADQVAQLMHAYGDLLTEVWRQKPSIVDATNLHYHLMKFQFQKR